MFFLAQIQTNKEGESRKNPVLFWRVQSFIMVFALLKVYASRIDVGKQILATDQQTTKRTNKQTDLEPA